MATAVVLKQNETLQMYAQNPIQGATVSYTSSKPSVASISNSGLITVLTNPTAPEVIYFFAKDEYGLTLGNAVVYAIPQSMAKSAVTVAAEGFLSVKYLKNGEGSVFSVNKGQGAHVGVTYESSNPSLVSISGSGIVTALSAVTEPTAVFLTSKDSVTGIVLTTATVTVVPEAVNIANIKTNATITVV